MDKNLYEFFNSHEATRMLVENLQLNNKVFLDALSPDQEETFMRLNLIMIRQCLEDFGIE